MNLRDMFYPLIHLDQKSFLILVTRFLRVYKNIKLVWNDVSGYLVDDSVVEFLHQNKENRYVLCHNLCLKRENVCNHINYINEDSQ